MLMSTRLLKMSETARDLMDALHKVPGMTFDDV